LVHEQGVGLIPIQQEQHRYLSPRGFQHWANHLAWQTGTLEDMESEDYESNQGSVRPKASI
jgi:hypothetical protein